MKIQGLGVKVQNDHPLRPPRGGHLPLSGGGQAHVIPSKHYTKKYRHVTSSHMRSGPGNIGPISSMIRV